MKKIYLICIVILVVFFNSISISMSQLDEKNSASEAIGAAERQIEEMVSLGFSVKRVNDTLNEAKILFDQEYYLGAKSLADQVDAIKQKAISVDKTIDQTEEKIYESQKNGLDVSEILVLFDEGLEAFETENYEDAENIMNKINEKIEEMMNEESLKRISENENLFSNLTSSWPLMVVITVVALISGLVFYRISRMRQAVKKLKNLKKEEESVQKLIKDVQRKYFKDGIISKLDYEITSKRYGERLANIRKDILLMQKIKKGQENIQKQKI